MNIEQAANTLELILDRIGESIDDDAKLKIRQEIIEFKRSLPWEPEFAELRRIAQETFDDLGRSINQSVFNRMRERAKELDKYIETISAITGRAEKNIETLRLKYVQAVTTAAKEMADAVRAIKSSIEANDLPAASEKTEESLDLILKLISDITKEA
jgi:uncharacterized protein YukE